MQTPEYKQNPTIDEIMEMSLVLDDDLVAQIEAATEEADNMQRVRNGVHDLFVIARDGSMQRTSTGRCRRRSHRCRRGKGNGITRSNQGRSGNLERKDRDHQIPQQVERISDRSRTEGRRAVGTPAVRL